MTRIKRHVHRLGYKFEHDIVLTVDLNRKTPVYVFLCWVKRIKARVHVTQQGFRPEQDLERDGSPVLYVAL